MYIQKTNATILMHFSRPITWHYDIHSLLKYDNAVQTNHANDSFSFLYFPLGQIDKLVLFHIYMRIYKKQTTILIQNNLDFQTADPVDVDIVK